MLAAGVDADRIITTMVLVAADRMARTAVNVNPGWGALTAELNLAASLRTANGMADHSSRGRRSTMSDTVTSTIGG